MNHINRCSFTFSFHTVTLIVDVSSEILKVRRTIRFVVSCPPEMIKPRSNTIVPSTSKRSGMMIMFRIIVLYDNEFLEEKRKVAKGKVQENSNLGTIII